MGCCIIGVITWFAFLSCWVSPLAVFEFVLHAACRVVSCSVLSGLWGAMGCAPVGGLARALPPSGVYLLGGFGGTLLVVSILGVVCDCSLWSVLGSGGVLMVPAGGINGSFGGRLRRQASAAGFGGRLRRHFACGFDFTRFCSPEGVINGFCGLGIALSRPLGSLWAVPGAEGSAHPRHGFDFRHSL